MCLRWKYLMKRKGHSSWKLTISCFGVCALKFEMETKKRTTRSRVEKSHFDKEGNWFIHLLSLFKSENLLESPHWEISTEFHSWFFSKPRRSDQCCLGRTEKDGKFRVFRKSGKKWFYCVESLVIIFPVCQKTRYTFFF